MEYNNTMTMWSISVSKSNVTINNKFICSRYKSILNVVQNNEVIVCYIYGNISEPGSFVLLYKYANLMPLPLS
jgi:hypothetical protein